MYNKLSSLEVQTANDTESVMHEKYKLNLNGAPTFNRFSCLDPHELAPGMTVGLPPGMSEPTCRERKQARRLSFGNRFRSPGMPASSGAVLPEHGRGRRRVRVG